MRQCGTGRQVKLLTAWHRDSSLSQRMGVWVRGTGEQLLQARVGQAPQREAKVDGLHMDAQGTCHAEIAPGDIWRGHIGNSDAHTGGNQPLRAPVDRHLDGLDNLSQPHRRGVMLRRNPRMGCRSTGT